MAARPSDPAFLTGLFEGLAGTWVLNRQLRSADPSEPSGRCAGQALFTTRPSPSPVIDPDGKLHVADAELLYHEHGEFEMMMVTGNKLTGVPTFAFSRKYIWRLQKSENGHTISIWFTKPGTETIDYLFHKIDIPFDEDQTSGSDSRLVLHGTGGHLCVEDFYSSSYAFTLTRPSEDSPFKLASWTTALIEHYRSRLLSNRHLVPLSVRPSKETSWFSMIDEDEGHLTSFELAMLITMPDSRQLRLQVIRRFSCSITAIALERKA